MSENRTRDAVLQALNPVEPGTVFTAEAVADVLAEAGVFIPLRKVAAEDVVEQADLTDPLWSVKADYWGARQASAQIQIYGAQMVADAQVWVSEAKRRLDEAGG